MGELEDISDISIHKALASLDCCFLPSELQSQHFNPQGSREPRPNLVCPAVSRPYISIHKALASLDPYPSYSGPPGPGISIHKALASLDPRYPQVPHPSGISIHKALASLDRGHGAGHGRETVFQSTRLSRASTYWWWGEERPYYKIL